MYQIIDPFLLLWQYGLYSVEDVIFFIIAYVILFTYLGFFFKIALGMFQTSENLNYRATFITSIIITSTLLILSMFIFLFVSWIILLFLSGFLIRYRHQLAYYKSIIVFFIVIMIYFLLFIIFTTVFHSNRGFIPLGNY